MVILPPDRGLRLTFDAGGSLVRHLATTRIVTPVAEAVAQTWVEVYCEAGPSAHEIFATGVFTGEAPVFREAVIRFGTAPSSVGYGVDTDAVCCFVEFRGCRYQSPQGAFRQRVQDLWLFRPEIFVRPHTDLPPHREVPADEIPAEKKRRGPPSTGLAGVRVEEL